MQEEDAIQMVEAMAKLVASHTNSIAKNMFSTAEDNGCRITKVARIEKIRTRIS